MKLQDEAIGSIRGQSPFGALQQCPLGFRRRQASRSPIDDCAFGAFRSFLQLVSRLRMRYACRLLRHAAVEKTAAGARPRFLSPCS
jgi:hypothetical protein